MITTADLCIVSLWKALEHCAVQACVVCRSACNGEGGLPFEGFTKPKLRKTKDQLQMEEIFDLY